MIGTSVTYRDDKNKNLRALVTKVYPVTGQQHPELDLVVVDEQGQTTTRTRVPHYSHRLKLVEEEFEERTGPGRTPEKKTRKVNKREDGEHWRY